MAEATRDVWQFWIDVGGTFTDCIGRRPDGQLLRHKLLSSGVTKGAIAKGSDQEKTVDPLRRVDPAGYWCGYRLRLLDREGASLAEASVAGFDRERGVLSLAGPIDATPVPGQSYELVSDEESPIQGIRYLLGLPREGTIPPVVVRLGTTRGTNALLTRSGARTALVTTRGFGDILHIGYQNRPRLFDLTICKPEPLCSTVVEIDERITAGGQVLKSPDPEAVRTSWPGSWARGSSRWRCVCCTLTFTRTMNCWWAALPENWDSPKSVCPVASRHW